MIIGMQKSELLLSRYSFYCDFSKCEFDPLDEWFERIYVFIQ